MQATNPSAVLEAFEEAIDPRDLRRCLGQFATGVTVITADTGLLRAGVTANSFSSVSLEPPLVLWSLKNTSRSHAVFETATHFAVNVLSSGQIDVAQHFASSVPDKFEGADWHRGRSGVPILSDVLAVIECRRRAVYPGGDHTIFIGEIEHITQYPKDALVFFQGRYCVPEDHPLTRNSGGLRPVPQDDKFLSLWTLLWRAYHASTEAFAGQREAEGLNAPQNRVLRRLSEVGPRQIEELSDELYLPLQVVRDAVDDLTSRDYVRYQVGTKLGITECGVERRQAVKRRLSQFEEQHLSDISPKEVAITRSVLERLISSLEKGRSDGSKERS